jgi:integrase
MSALKVVLKEAFYRGDIEYDPTAGIGNIRVERKKPGIFSLVELRRLFNPDDHPFEDERQRIAFLLAADTGMGRGEILAVQWGDVNLSSYIIIIQRAWKGKELGLPKANRSRIVPMTNRLYAALRSYFKDILTIRDENFIICWDDGAPISKPTINVWFNKAMKRMGIDKKTRSLSPHSFRHSIVTHLTQARVPLEVIQAMIGHVDEKTTAGYTHCQDQYLVEEIRKLED